MKAMGSLKSMATNSNIVVSGAQGQELLEYFTGTLDAIALK